MNERLEGHGEWQAAHEALVELASSRPGLDFEEGRRLLAARRSGAHVRLGLGSFAEYIERLFGYAPRLTHEKLRVAAALESLPELSRALAEGKATWSCARELTRVVTPGTERVWLEEARGRTVREVEKLVSGHRPGGLPSEPKEAKSERHVLRFEVSGEALATFNEAMVKLRRDAGGHLNDDAALLLMARYVLGGPSDEGRASYQVEVTVCEACGGAAELSNGELVPISDEAAAAVACDSQVIPRAGGDSKRATQDIAPSTRRAVLRRDLRQCRVPGCTHATFVDLHHLRMRSHGGTHDIDNLLTLCGAHHLAVHGGRLLVRENDAGEADFFHADGSEYGHAASLPYEGVSGRALRGLRSLGFGDGEAKRALAEAMTHVGPHAELEVLLREALRSLSERSLSRAS